MPEQKDVKIPTIKEIESRLKIALLEDLSVILVNVIFSMNDKMKNLDIIRKKEFLNDLIDAWKMKSTSERNSVLKAQAEKLIKMDESIELDVATVMMDCMSSLQEIVKNETIEHVRSYLLSSLRNSHIKNKDKSKDVKPQ